MIRWTCARTGRLLAVAYPSNGGWIAIRYDRFNEWHSTEALATSSIERSFGKCS